MQSTAESIFSIACSKCAQIVYYCLFVWFVGVFYSLLVMLMWSLIRCTYVLLTRICYSSSYSIVGGSVLFICIFSLFDTGSLCYNWQTILSKLSDTVSQTHTHVVNTYKEKDKIGVDFFLAGFSIKFTKCNGQFNKIETSFRLISLALSLSFLLLSVGVYNKRQTNSNNKTRARRKKSESSWTV